MRKLVIASIIFFFSKSIIAQNYERDKICKSDTIGIDVVNRKYGEHIKFKAFKCNQVTKLGYRFDLAFNHYNYNSNTKKWLGNHNGATFGMGIAYSYFTLSAEFKPATVSPKTELELNGEILTKQVKLNPIKIEYKLGYSINTFLNLAFEPYLAYTRSSFYVINEEELNKQYKIDKIHSPGVGMTINKYFNIKEFQFLSLFFKYGYSFTDFKKINKALGLGYSDISIGISYKGFMNREFLEKIN